MQKTVVIKVAKVAGAKPAVAGKCGPGLLGQMQVAFEDIRALGEDFPGRRSAACCAPAWWRTVCRSAGIPDS